MPCWAGARPVASDVSADAVVDGDDRRDRAAGHRRELGAARPRCASSWFQPEPVEDEQDDRGRVGDRLRDPWRRAALEQGRYDLIEGSGSVGGLHRLHSPVHQSKVLPPDRHGAERAERAWSGHAVRTPERPSAAVCDDGWVKVSTRGDYAARALLSLALHESDRPTSVKEIAERTNLPQPYLEQILLAVKGAGLVRSKRGVGGGYVLARPPKEITVARDPRRGRRSAHHAHG